MSEYRLSDDAEQDVAEMYRRGFWKFGEHQADKFYNQLFDSLELLASSPLTGRAADDIYPSLRRVEFNPYVIFYLPRDYGVYVVRLLRHSQIVKPEYLENPVKFERKRVRHLAHIPPVTGFCPRKIDIHLLHRMPPHTTRIRFNSAPGLKGKR